MRDLQNLESMEKALKVSSSHHSIINHFKEVAFHINNYFGDLIKRVNEHGADVIKFAGIEDIYQH